MQRSNRLASQLGIQGSSESYYNKKREKFRAKQKEFSDKITRLDFADEEYYLTSECLLQLANRSRSRFNSSGVEENRQLLKPTLQNLKIGGKKVEFELAKPFEKVFACVGSENWLPEQDSNLQPSG